MSINVQQIEQVLAHTLKSRGKVTILTGAGVSAESGIPTFRGPEGYWTVGSRNYQPHEIGTYAMFRKNPIEVWKWFLFRRSVCQKADPNPGHFAIAEMETILGNCFYLITQNVDGLHLRAGNTLARTYQVHGNLNYMRCASQCSASIYRIPDTIPPKKRGENLSEAERSVLRCPRCGSMTRPHVLLWDEYYNEQFYRFESSLRAGKESSLLIVVGTAGATNLPNQVVEEVLRHGGTIIDINIRRNPFTEAALSSTAGMFCQSNSAQALPIMVDLLKTLHNAKQIEPSGRSERDE